MVPRVNWVHPARWDFPAVLEKMVAREEEEEHPEHLLPPHILHPPSEHPSLLDRPDLPAHPDQKE